MNLDTHGLHAGNGVEFDAFGPALGGGDAFEEAVRDNAAGEHFDIVPGELTVSGGVMWCWTSVSSRVGMSRSFSIVTQTL